MADPINLAQKLSLFSDHWSPKIIANFNGHDVMVVKAEGEFVWHSHPDTDDFFLVIDHLHSETPHDRGDAFTSKDSALRPRSTPSSQRWPRRPCWGCHAVQ